MNHKRWTPAFLKLVAAASFHLFATALGLAQIIGNVPKNFILDGAIGEWDQQAPSFGCNESSVSNPIWIARSSQGLVVSGSAHNIVLAKDRSELSTRGRLEFWLSLSDEIDMPPVSWSGDDGTDDTCEGYDDSSKPTCLQWFRDQATYRQKLKALFTRMWRIAPNAIEEAHASANYASLKVAEQKSTLPLKPSGQLVAKFSLIDSYTFTYEILVPWEAFPPADRLHLERVKLALNIIQGDDVRITTERALGDLLRPALRSIAVVPPIVAHFTPCEYPLTGMSGEPAFFFLGPSLTVRRAFTFENGLPCCGNISLQQAKALSPYVTPIEHFVQTLGPGEFLCGSPITYNKGSVIKRFALDLGPGPGFSPLAQPPGTLAVHRLPNGTRLIRDGPSFWFQQQTYTMCAACPFGRLAILALTPTGEIKEALTLGGRVGDVNLAQYNIEMSSDWRTVTEFRNNNETGWVSRKFCLNGDTYQACGKDSRSPAPRHGLLPSLE
jgi:hypothetical protein